MPRSLSSASRFGHVGPSRRSATCRHARRAFSIASVLLTLVVMLLIALTAGSTMVALRMVKERDTAKQQADSSAKVIDQLVAGVSSSTLFKGKGEEARVKMLEPALQHYEQIVKQHEGEKPISPSAVEAQWHVAALKARLGSKESLPALSKGMGMYSQMLQAGAPPAENFPSFRASVLQVTPTSDWMSVKGLTGDESKAHMQGLFLSMMTAMNVMDSTGKQYPQILTPRDDLAEMRSQAAKLLGMAMMSDPGMGKMSLDYWIKARDVLETLVRDQPANLDFKNRLAESLVGAAKLQRSNKDLAGAIENYTRALALREEMVTANPEDKASQQEVTSIKSALEKLKAAETAAKENAPKESAPKEAASDAQPAAEAAPAATQAPAADADAAVAQP